MSDLGDIFSRLSRLKDVSATSIDELKPHLDKRKPFVVRGLVKNWPLVLAGKRSGKAARDYLQGKVGDRPFVVSMGSDEFQGRIFYRDDMSMNFQTGKATLPVIFERIDKVENDDNPPIIYMGSVNMRHYFKGLQEDNHFQMGDRALTESIWMGTKSRIAAHNDFPENLAFVCAGRRRFTLFPPSEFKNLYLGPIDNTPAGRAISMVDFHAPDFENHPNFKQAIEAGQTAILEPGDAIHIPSTWWHHVEGLEPFNVLVNYWWRDTPRYLGSPQDALNHAIMAIKDLAPDDRSHWREMFDHYVFENSDDVTNHIPEHGRGILGPMTPKNASKIRSFLIKMLSNE